MKRLAVLLVLLAAPALTAVPALLAVPAAAVDTPPSSDLPDLSAIRAQIYSGEYEAAVKGLTELSATVRHADIYNLLGFATRKLGRYEESARWYKEALYYDPTHRPAIEYQGELFIATGDLEGARGNLQILDLLCPSGCPERETLAAAIAGAEKSPQPR
ncbi:Flp pilus assembly protein TadD [Pseudochelatococcus lubricantis]|uniref:Flp pilus assembly protein TadD n=1 Tax=Pseudochelatococcus lubricantis TaxID=1538102 RepID=A0ABX0V3H4_9HYPH|nr:tetratricopeptide repeat protein [Pseudochelatococcus lubricantis]NIJ59686.1 Flp pilus assembly protein TadD [Pseudochelatococcus lubricantis]